MKKAILPAAVLLSLAAPASAATDVEVTRFHSAETIAALPQVMELNIGHFLIGEAVFEGLDQTIKMMRAAMDRGRARA